MDNNEMWSASEQAARADGRYDAIREANKLRDDEDAYRKEAAECIINEARWAKHFPQQSMDRIIYIAECLYFRRQLPERSTEWKKLP